MTERTDPALLYPDIAAHGSLGAALRAAAEAEGFSLRETGEASLLRASFGSVVPHRGSLAVSGWAIERRWSIRGEESVQDLALVEGRSRDLAQVARVVRAWRDGVELDGVCRAAPFVEPTGRFEVPDGDPVLLAESEWRHLRFEAASKPTSPRYRELIEAAYAEPVLRGLYPFTSHGTLRFSSTTRPRLSLVGPCLSAYSGGRFMLMAVYMGSSLAETDTAAEAVAAAVRHMPPGIGPVTSGV
ncbi:DUF6193 family natural product biosynthesis protein [Streptomyces sp. NPDC048718]|uniref:DUF6193 family natural product biosynthesis protein n=1 Tax=Streptomyces sp. NPDC048718 TaxID=3365587 RepID=UPI003710C238